MVMTRDQTEPEYEIPDLYPQQTSRKDQGYWIDSMSSILCSSNVEDKQLFI